jgi:predicted secreted hydrolase
MRRLTILLSLGLGFGCAPAGNDRGAGDATDLGQFLAASDVTGFERALESRPFEFPRDHASHPSFRTEWWYFTGHLTDQQGRAFGFQLTFFRFALTALPPGEGSAWRSRDAWMGHFAVTDVTREEFLYAERISRDGLALAGSTREPFRLWIEDWSAEAVQGEPFPLRLRAGIDAAAIDLTVHPTRPPVAQGDRGLDRKGPEPGNASYYYSLPRLEAAGELRVRDSAHAVSGSVWMDREWSSNALSPDLAGWDWLSVSLTDGRDLMVYRLRTRDGGSSPFSGGSLALGDGRVRALARDDIVLTERERWTSPATGVRYPIGWNVRVPDENLDLEVRALIPSQEMNLSVRYWEGAVVATGSSGGREIEGRGYLELTGY